MGQNYKSSAIGIELSRVSLIFSYALREVPIALEVLSPFGKSIPDLTVIVELLVNRKFHTGRFRESHLGLGSPRPLPSI